MSAAATSVSPAPTAPHGQVGLGVQFSRVVLSEWTKLRTVRSTMWTLLATLLVCIGLPVLISFAIINW